MSLQRAGTWQGGVWEPTVWADGVWYETSVISAPPAFSGGRRNPAPARAPVAKAQPRIDDEDDLLVHWL